MTTGGGHQHEISDVNHLQEELEDQEGSLVRLTASTSDALELLIAELANLTERVARMERTLNIDKRN